MAVIAGCAWLACVVRFKGRVAQTRLQGRGAGCPAVAALVVKVRLAALLAAATPHGPLQGLAVPEYHHTIFKICVVILPADIKQEPVE